MKRHFSLRILLIVPLSLLLVGCGGKDKPVPVEGVVTLDGKPLAGATVRFVPLDSGGTQAGGMTGDDGSFKLTTTSTGDGAKPGKYKIVITMTKTVEGTSPAEANDPGTANMQAMKQFQNQNKQKKPRPEVTIHDNYQSEEKTPLKQEVPADGKVTIELNKNGS